MVEPKGCHVLKQMPNYLMWPRRMWKCLPRAQYKICLESVRWIWLIGRNRIIWWIGRMRAQYGQTSCAHFNLRARGELSCTTRSLGEPNWDLPRWEANPELERNTFCWEQRVLIIICTHCSTTIVAKSCMSSGYKIVHLVPSWGPLPMTQCHINFTIWT